MARLPGAAAPPHGVNLPTRPMRRAGGHVTYEEGSEQHRAHKIAHRGKRTTTGHPTPPPPDCTAHATAATRRLHAPPLPHLKGPSPSSVTCRPSHEKACSVHGRRQCKTHMGCHTWRRRRNGGGRRWVSKTLALSTHLPALGGIAYAFTTTTRAAYTPQQRRAFCVPYAALSCYTAQTSSATSYTNMTSYAAPLLSRARIWQRREQAWRA